MKINNMNYDKTEYKGNKMEKQLSLKEIINNFYAVVRRQMPVDREFDDIEMQCAQDEKGKYFINIHTFLNNRTNSNVNCLDVTYIPNDKDFEMSMNLLEGSKQEILDFLGNENNLDKIESYMIQLKKKSDLK